MNKAAKPSRDTVLFFCIAAAFVLIRIPAVMGNHFGMECAYILEVARRPLRVLIENSPGNTFSPSYFLVLKTVMTISRADWWITSYTVVVGLVTLALIKRTCETLFSPRSGLLAAALFAAAPYGIFMTTEIRYHNLFALFALWSYYEFALAVRDGCPANRAARWAVASTLAMYTFHFSIYLIAFQNLYMLLTRRFGARWAAANAAVAIAYSPWALILKSQAAARIVENTPWSTWVHSQLIEQHSFINMVDIAASLTGGRMILAHGHDPVSRFVFIGTIAVLCAAAAGMLFAISGGRNAAQAKLLTVTIAGVFALTYSGFLFLRVPLFERYCSGFMPLLIVFAGAGLGELRSRSAVAAFIALFFAVSFLSIKTTYAQIFSGKKSSEAVAFLIANNPDRAPVVAMPRYVTPVIWFYGYDGPVISAPTDFNIVRDNSDFFITGREQLETLGRRLRGQNKFWVFDEVEGRDMADKSGWFDRWLSSNCRKGRMFIFKNGPFAIKESRMMECFNKMAPGN